MTGRATVSPRSAFGSLTPHQQGLVAVLGAAVLWSTGGLFIKWVSLDALGVTMWRSFLASIVMLVVARPRMHLPWKTNRLTWGIAISYALTLVMFVSATKMTTAASAIFLQYTAPLYLLASGAIFLGEKPAKLDYLTVAVAFCGMALFFVGKLDASAVTGNVLAAASGITLAAMFTLLRAPGCGPSTRPGAMVLGNFILVFGLLAVNLGRGSSEPFTPDARDMAGLAFLGVVQIGFAYLLFSYGVAYVQALEASLIGMLEPVLNPVWVFLFLGESPGWWAVLGGAIIVGAVTVRTIAAERGRTDASEAVIPADI
ncbi:MAG TPA: DMT family transporter [Tepidiformaceae bacterium]|nr:DMT family transporter [Tepidiformaceae bacterium]